MPMLWRSTVLAAGLLAVSAGLPALADGGGDNGGNGIKRVLLISIDGMHALEESAGSTAVHPIARIWPSSRRRA